MKHIKPVAAQPRKKRHPWASSPETSDESDDEPAEVESEPAEALPTVREEDPVEAPAAEVVDLAVAEEPARGRGAEAGSSSRRRGEQRRAGRDSKYDAAY